MKHWTIGKRIIVGFASVILIAGLLGAFAYTRLTNISVFSNRIASKSLPTLKLCDNLKVNLKGTLLCIYQHIGSDDKQEMAQLEEQISTTTAANTQTYDEINKLLITDNARELLERVRIARADYTKVREEVLAISRQATNNALAFSTARKKLDPLAAKFTVEMDSLIDNSAKESDADTKGIQTAVNTSQFGILLGLGLALLAGIAIAYTITHGTNLILNRVSANLNDGAHQVVAAAKEVSGASQSLAEGASEQAASLEETSSSLEELSSMTKRNAENSQKANDLAKQAHQAAEKGADNMKSMAAAMEGIRTSSDDIAKIIKTIDEIAFQTNILALNAAVEAARAGEAGMGFAVVADEVRNLAQRCAQAAQETSSKIEGAIGKTRQGVEISNQVGVALEEIVNTSRQVDELVAEVAQASKEQSQGIDQINTAVTQMDKVTQSNAANAEESASAAEELNAQAESMTGSVSELLELVGGQHTARSNRTTASQTATSHPKISSATQPRTGEEKSNSDTFSADSPNSRLTSKGKSEPLNRRF